MVLPKSAFGRLPAQVQVEHPVGFYSNAEQAKRGADPGVTRASLTRQGRLLGYVLGYSRSQSQLEAALMRGSGPLNVLSEVELYRSSTGAASRMRQAIKDLRRLVGKPIKGGATLERGTTFRLHQIGDAAVGLRFKVRVRVDTPALYYTEVVFRYGRLLAYTTEARADGNNVDSAVISFAQTLEDRIEGVLRGRIRAEPDLARVASLLATQSAPNSRTASVYEAAY